jgi:ferredoxin-NADP reductase
MKPLKFIDDWLNHITMYRLLLYGLAILIAIVVVFCFAGTLSLSGPGLLLSTAILVSVCFITNFVLARLFKAPANSESSLITALILVCIMPPITSVSYGLGAAAAGVIAILSKYFVAWRHKHLFNPAAFGATAIGFLGLVFANWWIGNPTMLPFTLFFGALVLRKIHRFHLFFAFVAAALLTAVLVGLTTGQNLDVALHNMILSGPLIFLGTIMLTEPATMPPTRYYRYLFGIIIGVLLASQLHLTEQLYTNPERALLVGNLFAFIVTYRARLTLKLKEKILISPVVYEYVFTPNYPLKFLPGQYMEWTLPLKRSDGRGNRRSFTIASSPTESDVHLGVKFYEPSSRFKQHLKSMQPGDTITAGMLSGDFVLPLDPRKKLVWIAGGIGITPFRSHAKYLIDKVQKRDVELFYVVSDPAEIAYKDLWDEARALGINTTYVLSSEKVPTHWKGLTGRLTAEQITAVPDWQKRTYFISGPNAMVEAYKTMLRKAGVPRRNIVTDYFAGY